MFTEIIEQGDGERSAYNPLSKYFCQSSKGLVELLFCLLQFNPDKRYTAAEALKNPIFDSIRNKNLEKSAKNKIHLDFDQRGCYDYVTGSDHFFKKRKDYRIAILKER